MCFDRSRYFATGDHHPIIPFPSTPFFPFLLFPILLTLTLSVAMGSREPESAAPNVFSNFVF